VLENSGKSHGVLLLNSNAMEYSFTPTPSLTLRSIGGIFDFYFIVDNEPKGVLQNYHQVFLIILIILKNEFNLLGKF
jgi:alpha-glucosidase (family GH31 glycosyl hydrolase)